MLDNFDVIIIGSGLSGVHSAIPLVESGLKVLMLCGGVKPDSNLEESFDGTFESIRRNRDDQYKLFLGTKLNDIISSTESHVMSMTSGNKDYISKHTENLKIAKGDVELIQTLAEGGLSEAWSAACYTMTSSELEKIGIEDPQMNNYYQKVIDRIGVSGHLEGLKTESPIIPDNHAKTLLNRFKKIKSKYILKTSVLAVLTKDLDQRKTLAYNDTEFFLNQNKSIYRAKFDLEKLKLNPNFKYQEGVIVDRILKDNDARIVIGHNFEGKEVEFRSNYVVMASGALSTARIILKSENLLGTKIPFSTKNHFIIPTINLKSIGKKDEEHKCSLTQLFLIDKSLKDGMQASFSQLISYKSLLLYKLAKFIPLPTRESMTLASLLAPSMVSIDIKFPSSESDAGSIYLDDENIIHIEAGSKPKSFYAKELLRIKLLLLRLKLIPLKTVENPFGSTAHYTGGIPFNDNNKPLFTDRSGRLNRDNNIVIADASTWRSQPAKPPGLTIMANANRIGEILARDIKNQT